MKAKKLDGVEVWKEFEDVAIRLGLNVVERAVYSHLLLHTRLEGKLRERFTTTEVACKVRISRGPVREAIRRLADLGALRFVERGYSGHLLEVRLPAEVAAARRKCKTSVLSKAPGEPNLEQMDFLTSQAPRQAIHAREGGKCFYCRRRTSGRSRCLDHVVPRAKSGQNSYRNVVSCCTECNWQKKDHAAADFLRELYRQGGLSRKDLSGGLQKLQALAAGKLRPQVFHGEDAGSEQSGLKREEVVGVRNVARPATVRLRPNPRQRNGKNLCRSHPENRVELRPGMARVQAPSKRRRRFTC